MSESLFDDKNCMIKSHSRIREIIRNNETIVKAVKKNGLYDVIASAEINVIDSSSSMTLNQTKLWHNRLGHIGNKGLKYL